MSFESSVYPDGQESTDNTLSELKPPAKFVDNPARIARGNVHKLLIEKAMNDLELLKNGKMSIEYIMANNGIEDEEVDKQLKKLGESIKTLEGLIKKYEDDTKDEPDIDYFRY